MVEATTVFIGQSEFSLENVNFPEERIMVRKFALLEAIASANYRVFSSKIRFFRKVDIFSSESPENREFHRNRFELFFTQYCSCVIR